MLPIRQNYLQINRKADARTRTGDPFITSEVLYQLSYVGTAWEARFEYSSGRAEPQIAASTES